MVSPIPRRRRLRHMPVALEWRPFGARTLAERSDVVVVDVLSLDGADRRDRVRRPGVAAHRWRGRPPAGQGHLCDARRQPQLARGPHAVAGQPARRQRRHPAGAAPVAQRLVHRVATVTARSLWWPAVCATPLPSASSSTRSTGSRWCRSASAGRRVVAAGVRGPGRGGDLKRLGISEKGRCCWSAASTPASPVTAGSEGVTAVQRATDSRTCSVLITAASFVLLTARFMWADRKSAHVCGSLCSLWSRGMTPGGATSTLRPPCYARVQSTA